MGPAELSMALEEDNSEDPDVCCASLNEGGPRSAVSSPASPSDSSDATEEEEDMHTPKTPGGTQAIGESGKDKVGKSQASTGGVKGYHPGSSSNESNIEEEPAGSGRSPGCIV